MISRNNNFDFLRLIFAVLVVITHSYPLSGANGSDFLSQLTFGQMSLSYIGVKGFFIISGFLIFKSLLHCKNLPDFYWKRILRLFPALFVVLLLTVALAPAVYEHHVPYWKNISVYTYIPRNISLFFLQYKINGVFGNNPFPGSINGSLWTICYEFSMYIMVSLLFFIRKKSVLKITVGMLFISSYLLAVHASSFLSSTLLRAGLDGKNFYDLMCFFTGGMLLTYLNIRDKRLENLLIMFSIIVLAGSVYLKIVGYTCFFTLPILVIFIGRNSTIYINRIGDVFGDISYGIYIYSFPIQQALMYFYKLNTIPLMILSLVLSLLFGYFSWHLIEARALGYKDLVSKRPIHHDE
ncbi:acyltransferase family protein [Chryseobacterium aurantiacum]|uniref:acyltransferase family protein n=1 Tax=Chryseobacterium aurantiacum TaxID=2116499 RepID=UPI000D139536|nr:acyltransferase [Chryseobacterium aurantiacum]